ncbi:MAG: hypothetical protein AAGJ35_10210, partial [Myxococcota bacterium]
MASGQEVCNHLDDDCDGKTDEGIFCFVMCTRAEQACRRPTQKDSSDAVMTTTDATRAPKGNNNTQTLDSNRQPIQPSNAQSSSPRPSSLPQSKPPSMGVGCQFSSLPPKGLLFLLGLFWVCLRTRFSGLYREN